MKIRSFYGFILNGVAGLALVGIMACGGSKKDKITYATTLDYSSPITDGYRLVTNTARSTDKRLVLDLRGPDSNTQETVRGVFFSLHTDKSVLKFVKVDESDTELAQNEIFDLGSGEPKLLLGIVNDTGDTLSVMISQKGQGNAQRVNQVLARVALEFHSTDVPSNTRIPLSMGEALILPYNNGNATPIEVKVGPLMAR